MVRYGIRPLCVIRHQFCDEPFWSEARSKREKYQASPAHVIRPQEVPKHVTRICPSRNPCRGSRGTTRSEQGHSRPLENPSQLVCIPYCKRKSVKREASSQNISDSRSCSGSLSSGPRKPDTC